MRALMDPELKTKWVAALRSGKYKQGTGYLWCDGEYCCMGVLCEVKGLPKTTHPDDRVMLYGDHQSVSFPPEEAGLPYATVDGKDCVNTLIMLNDRDHKSFSEIADYIESNIP